MRMRQTDAQPKSPLPPVLPGVGLTGWCRVHPVYWLPAMSFFAWVMLSPADLPARAAWVAGFCEFMTRAFPFLDSHAGLSSFPGLTTVVKCASFALIPLFVALPIIFVWRDRGAALQRRIDAGSVPPPWWLELNVLGILAVAFAGNWVLAGDPLSCDGCTTRSRFGLALTSSVALFAMSFVPIAVMTSIYIRLGLRFGTKERS